MQHRQRRLVVLLLAAGMLSTACSRVPPDSTAVLGSESGAFTPDVLADGSLPDNALGGTPGDGATGTGDASDGEVLGGPSGASVDSIPGENATLPGAGPESRTAPGSAEKSAQGVNGRTVNIVFHAKLRDCGPDASTARMGTATEKGLKAIDDYVTFYNKFVLGPYGWKLAHKVIDDGGQYCAEKARAAAQKIVKELKPFAVLGDSANGDQGPVLADIVTRAKIVNVGISWSTVAELRNRHPYAWPIYGLAEQQDRHLVEWMAKRVKGTQARDVNTGAPAERVYGLITADNPEQRTLAAMTKANLAKQGIRLAHTYLVSSDPGVAAQSANNTVLKMKGDGVNTLIFAIPYTSVQSAVVHTSAMSAQNYTPDLLSSRHGIVFFDRLFDSRVWSKMRGVFQCEISCTRATGKNPDFIDVNENSRAYKTAWAHLGNTDDPENGTNPGAYTTWTMLAQLSAGILNAGPVLNAATYAAGLDAAAPGGPAECIGWRLMGRPYTYASYSGGWSSRHDTGIIGFTPGYWVEKKNEFGTVGYYESYDNYRYFLGGDLPKQATRDTGQSGVAVPKQKPIGLKPWVSCTELGLKDRR